MEFLFVNQIASIEAMIVFACMLIIVSIFGYDGFLYVRRVLLVLFPKRNSPLSEGLPREIAPTVSPFSETFKEKNPEESHQAFTTIDGVVLGNPILYPENEIDQEGVPEILSEVLLIENPLLDHVELDWVAWLTDDDTAYIGESLGKKEEIAPPVTADISLQKPIVESISDREREENIHQEDLKSLVAKEEKFQWVRKENISEAQKKGRYEEKSSAKSPKKPHIKPEKREKLIEIINNVKTLIARGQIDDARALIVSGLSIEKDNRELNLLMASLYERDHAFAKAEFILKDIATENPDDIEILTHLATDLAMQRKYDVSYELYKKILSLGGESEECLYTLTHLASEMSLSEDVVLYARSYLKQYPHNPEILWIYVQWLISRGQRKEAVETLIKLKNLTPYNQEIADLIQKLVTEEELAGNFWGER